MAPAVEIGDRRSVVGAIQIGLAWQEAEKGRGLCPWTPLEFETPDPQILRN
jgi:hypothetical protein